VRVVVIEIQILFEFKLFVIYKIVLKKEKVFLFEFGFWAESSARLAGLPGSAQPAWPSRPAPQPSGSWACTQVAKPNLTR
jgi:hypothetical protein